MLDQLTWASAIQRSSLLRSTSVRCDLMGERRRPNVFGRRGISNAGRIARRPSGDCFPSARTEILDRGR
jgi:hypothetical protein